MSFWKGSSYFFPNAFYLVSTFLSHCSILRGSVILSLENSSHGVRHVRTLPVYKISESIRPQFCPRFRESAFSTSSLSSGQSFIVAAPTMPVHLSYQSQEVSSSILYIHLNIVPAIHCYSHSGSLQRCMRLWQHRTTLAACLTTPGNAGCVSHNP